MKIYIENLGALRQAEFSLGEMTIICGCNNTGKTYATYALYGFLSYWREAMTININDKEIEKLLVEGTVHLDLSDYIINADKILSDGCNSYTRQLSIIYAANKDRFKDTKFQITLAPGDIQPMEKFNRAIRSAAKTEIFSISKSAENMVLLITLLIEKSKVKVSKSVIKELIGNSIKDIIFGHLFPEPFIASAERTGSAIFRKELNFARNRLIEEIGQGDKNIDPRELLFKAYQDYALPVKDNVDFTRQIETLSKKTSWIAENHPTVLKDFSDIIGGEYTVTRNDELYYIPSGKRIKLTMDESSSAVRSLLDIGFYLRHVASPGDLLMVDEPELNLHPENQRRIARLFARLINLGIKVFITTHSDYLLKELSFLIMLKQDKPHLKRILKREKYQQEELVSSDKIKVYIAE